MEVEGNIDWHGKWPDLMFRGYLSPMTIEDEWNMWKFVECQAKNALNNFKSPIE